MYRNLFFILFFLISNLILSQEILNDLDVGSSSSICSKENFSKNISLPFIDDFSNYDEGLNTSLWYPSAVLLNSSYSIDPPTIGVATFDGLDKFGFPYSIGLSNSEGPADTLVSKEIDLSNINDGYLLFYYQPQGIGDKPEVADSLILEFKDVTGNWILIWKTEGSYNYDFKKHVININSPNFLIEGFQFRFRNLATLT